MTIEISELRGSPPRRVVVAKADDFAEAKDKARELFDVAFMDDDDDHADCADFITQQGAIYAIQPRGFSL
jgi:hypothetical protein